MAAPDLPGHDEPVVAVVAAVERGGVGARKSAMKKVLGLGLVTC